MDMSIMAVDVDGSLANPVMRTAVVIWGVVLGAFLTIGFCYIRERWSRVLCAVVVGVVGCAFSPVVHRSIAILIYQATTRPGVRVGFFGGPPFWVSPVLAFATAGVAAMLVGRSVIRAEVTPRK